MTSDMNLIQGFVNNPVKVTVGVILVLLFGVLAATRMPMQLTPEVEIPTLTLECPVGTNMQEAMLKVKTKLAQVPDYPEDAKEPVINTSNAADQPIAWFILSQKLPDRTEADKLAAKHPELKSPLDKAYAAQSAGLTMLRLRRLAAKDERVRAWLPPERDITTLRKYAEDF